MLERFEQSVRNCEYPIFRPADVEMGRRGILADMILCQGGN